MSLNAQGTSDMTPTSTPWSSPIKEQTQKKCETYFGLSSCVSLPKLLPSRESLVTDADFFLTNLNSTLFPGISSDIEVHSGFADEQAL